MVISVGIERDRQRDRQRERERERERENHKIIIIYAPVTHLQCFPTFG